jgi:DNA repair protein RecO (recombination protein O)
VLFKTRGIVFRFTRYGETSIIVSIFTDQFGLQSYMVNGVRTKSSKSKMALYQPLTLVELVVYHRENANINRIKEIRCLHPYQSIHHDFHKSSIAMFMNEVLNKTVREESHSHNLCEFIISSLITLDTMAEHVENFHLQFLLKLSGFLGFGAQTVKDILGLRITDPAIEDLLKTLMQNEYTARVSCTNPQRREALNLLLSFYNDHLGLGELKSLQVLREMMR